VRFKQLFQQRSDARFHFIERSEAVADGIEDNMMPVHGPIVVTAQRISGMAVHLSRKLATTPLSK
jgi:hypothetical protein